MKFIKTSSVTGSLKKLIQLPRKEKKLFAEAVFFLYLAWLMTLIFPFKRCLKFITGKGEKKEGNLEVLKQIKFALHRANYLRVWDNVCLVSSFAGRWMLNRRGISSELSIGVAKDEKNKLIAHAWIIANGYEIIRKGIFFYEIYRLKQK